MKTARSRFTPLKTAAVFVAASVALSVGSFAFAAPDSASSQAGADALPDDASKLSPKATLDAAKNAQSRMQDTLTRIVQLQELAKKQKDIVKLNCVNDKLTQVKGHLAVSDSAVNSLNEAVAKSDDGGRQQEYTRVTILYQKVLVLGTEAENCIGEDLSYIGAVKVELVIDPTIPQADVTAFDFPSLDTTRPPVASAL